MASEKNQKEQQGLVYKLSLLEQQMNQVQQQIESISQGVDDLKTLDIGLDELRGSLGKEIMAPLGRGIFVRATINSKDLTVDVGARNFVKKNIPETKEIISNQVTKLLTIKEDLNATLEKISDEAEKTLREFQKEQS